ASVQGGRDGVLVKVRSERGQEWLGTFAFGHLTPNGVSGIFTTPDPDRLCVVAAGEGYFVSANRPTSWEGISVVPILDVRPVAARDIIVFADFTNLAAYGKTDLKWRTKRLSWDDLKITEVTDSFIKGEFWDILSEQMASFVVDLATGAHTGGRTEI
ncbi:MAG: hypothetical protein J2P54_16270, partial [Bradyrhizobiaceae bacterium]|nr:hypothetical protein [Bradyrhizobiaceae bacterium]